MCMKKEILFKKNSKCQCFSCLKLIVTFCAMQHPGLSDLTKIKQNSHSGITLLLTKKKKIKKNKK